MQEFFKHSFHSVTTFWFETAGNKCSTLFWNTPTWPWLVVVNRHIHQAVLITSFSRRNDLVPMETRLCCVRTRSGSSTIFFFFFFLKVRPLNFETTAYIHTQVHTPFYIHQKRALLRKSQTAYLSDSLTTTAFVNHLSGSNLIVQEDKNFQVQRSWVRRVTNRAEWTMAVCNRTAVE